MLLTITYEGPNAANLGYLLHKNPYRPQTFQLRFGCAHVFYPEITESRCTAALLLDIDPIALARKKHGGNNDLFAYVNDRPYVASSFLSTALATVFGTAMSGRCSEKRNLQQRFCPLRSIFLCFPAAVEKQSCTNCLNRLDTQLKRNLTFWTSSSRSGGKAVILR